MFRNNDIVLYNQTEVCRVEDIRSMPFLDSPPVDYYVLRPVYDDSPAHSTIYVPVSANETRVRRVYSADELRQILAGDARAPWIENAMLRRRAFSEILGRNRPEELVGLIRTLAERQSAGRRFSDADEKALAAAEKQLYPLFKYILNVSQTDFLALVGEKPAAQRSNA